MSLVQKNAPDFSADAVLCDGTIGKINLTDYRGKYVVLFFYPADFTFVCPTEIIAFNRSYEAFKKLNTELIAVSVDSVYSHFAWRNIPVKEGGIGPVAFPMIGDLTKKISADYGVLLKKAGLALRGLFLIDKDGVVRHEVINDLPLGRSVDEAQRMVEALQFYETFGEVCPANWHHGDSGMVATEAGVKDYNRKNF